MPLLKGGGHVLVPGGTGLFPFGGRRNDLVQDSGYIHLYEIELPTSPPTRIRLASWPEDVVFGTNSSGEDLTYEAGSVQHNESRETVSGGLPTVTLTVSNVRRDIGGYLDTHDGLAGQPVRYLLADSANLANGQPVRREDYEVLESSLRGSTATLRLGQYNLQRARFPRRRLSKPGGAEYKGPECGYVGALPSCDQTLNGSNGCVVHDNAARFCGFRGMPRTTGLGT